MKKILIFPMILATYALLSCSSIEQKAVAAKESKPQVETKSDTNQSEEQKVRTAKGTEATKKSSLLLEIENKYSKTAAFSSKIKKTLKLKMLDQEKKMEGELLVKKPGMFRLELEGEEKSLAVSDGKTVWVVTYPSDPSFDNTLRVLRTRNAAKVQSQTLLAFTLGQGRLLKNYKIKSQKDSGDQTTYDLESKNKNEDINKISLVVSKEKQEIVSLKYSDKLENTTMIEFSQNQFDRDLNTKQFKFSVPKGAELTEI